MLCESKKKCPCYCWNKPISYVVVIIIQLWFNLLLTLPDFKINSIVSHTINLITFILISLVGVILFEVIFNIHIYNVNRHSYQVQGYFLCDKNLDIQKLSVEVER